LGDGVHGKSFFGKEDERGDYKGKRAKSGERTGSDLKALLDLALKVANQAWELDNAELPLFRNCV
jgi:hypothetical protein